MVQEGASNVIFRYKPDQYRPGLYFPVIGAIYFLLLHLIAPVRFDIPHHPYYYGFYWALLTIFGLAIYLYRRTYSIAMGAQGLIVSSYLGSKEISYGWLGRVELTPISRAGQRLYKLQVLNDRGSSVLRITGAKSEMERVAGVLNARVSRFG